jgi:hypothetical protein
MAWRLDRSRYHHGAPCSICGSYEDVQMHHVNPIKNIGLSKGPIHLYKGAMERTQIPLCRIHHLEVHKGY